MRTLGRYELLTPLARGGMAEVYLARRRVAGVEKRLVIKRLRRERISDPRFLDLFVKEAQLSMSLVQQNIVPVFDFGRVGDDVFLAMEHIDGKDLGSTLARAKGVGMPAVIAAFVAAECCQALHHAHSGASGRNVVHRDVTPRNVLLSWSGEVKLADFGIAAAMGMGDSSLVGTPGYMAPEQARGQAIDARTDLYALGLVLWEMLTGEHVRRGADALVLLEAAKRGELPELPEDIPGALASVVARATAADPAERIGSARVMADELDAFIVGERARHGGVAPAQQLATWLAARWQGARDEPLDLPRGEDGRVVTFLDDGAAGILGTGTQRSMAVTGAAMDDEDDEDDEDDAPSASPTESAPSAEPHPRAADQADVASSAAPAPSSPPASASARVTWRRWGALAVAGLAAVIAAAALIVSMRAPQRASGADARAANVATMLIDARWPTDSREASRVPDAASDAPLADASAPGARADARGRSDARGQIDARPRVRADAAAQAAPPDAGASPRRRFSIGAKPWAHVAVDDSPQRHETPVTLELTLGVHRLRFDNPELGVTREVTIDVTADGPSSYVLDLR